MNTHQAEKRFLFVCGVARSGTSTMADLLRAHPAIAMGRERYAWRFRAGDEFSPALFEKERFCLQFSPEDSHQTAPQPYYASLYPRFDQCIYVGDKLPNLYQRYPGVLSTFPGCRIIYMARNVLDVAASFQGRAGRTQAQIERNPRIDASRRWPADRDWRQAVVEWNEGVEATLSLAKLPRLFVADYDLLYCDDTLLERLFAFLGLPLTQTVVAAWNAGKDGRRRIEAEKKPLLSEAQMEYIRQHAYIDRFERLLQTRG